MQNVKFVTDVLFPVRGGNAKHIEDRGHSKQDSTGDLNQLPFSRYLSSMISLILQAEYTKTSY